MIPEWVLKQKRPGTTVKQIGDSYYLYRCTSKRIPDKSYPVSVQSYIGKITKSGVMNEKASLLAQNTEACLLKDLVKGLDARFDKVINFTKLDKTMKNKTVKKKMIDYMTDIELFIRLIYEVIPGTNS